MTHDSKNLDTSIEYRVTGPAVYCHSGNSCGDISIGDLLRIEDGRVDEQGDVLSVGHGYITASSLTPVTGSGDIRIPRADLPEVEGKGLWAKIDGLSYHFADGPTWHRKNALRHLALAEYLERRESEAVAADTRRNTRRAELLAELAPEEVGPFPSAGRLAALNAAIDRIVEMEEAAK